MEERFRFVEEWNSGDWSLAELCRFYGVSRKTGYKWVGRYEAGGLEALRDLSRAAHEHPNAVAAEMEDLVIALLEKHPSWGAPKIRARLERNHPGQSLPVESTLGAILKRHGLTVPRKHWGRSHRPHTTRPRLARIRDGCARWNTHLIGMCGVCLRAVRCAGWESMCLYRTDWTASGWAWSRKRLYAKNGGRLTNRP